MTALRTPRDEVSILMIDDDDLDAEMLRRQLKKTKLKTPLVHVRDGTEGLDVLRGSYPEKVITRPLLILLDVNMPKMGGIRILARATSRP